MRNETGFKSQAVVQKIGNVLSELLSVNADWCALAGL